MTEQTAKYVGVAADENEQAPAVATAVSEPSSKHDERFEIDETDAQTWTKGEVQPPAYRDKWFAVAYLLHLAAIITTAITLGPNMMSSSDGDRRLDEDTTSWENTNGSSSNVTDESKNVFGTDSDSSSTASQDVPPGMFPAILIVALIMAPLLSIVSLGVMSKNAEKLLQFSLLFSIALNVVLLVVAAFYGIVGSVIFHAILIAILICYAMSVWHRIPYAAANLKTAVGAVQLNLGLVLVSMSALVLLVVWICTWTVAFGGVWSVPDLMTTKATREECDQDGNCIEPGDTVMTGLGVFLTFLFILSFHWTQQVLQNVVRATVAGTIGTWWFSPIEASSFCSRGVCDSLHRSTTYSLGSICLGSLIVAILQMLRSMLRSAANNRRGGILRCIAQCILLYLERLVEYFNKWAFIYVGLYGYSYLEAGKSVIDLFKARGWSAIISDNLVNRLLAIVILTIGLLVGAASVLVSLGFELADSESGWLLPAFFIGFLIGLILAGILMGVVSSAVDTVIVCFAEAPAEFKENHPELSQELETTWAAAWPDMGFGGVAVVTLGAGPGIV